MSNDKFQAEIIGTVERVRPYSKGDVVTVAVKTNPKSQYPDRVTVWCEGSAPVGEGQRVMVSGAVSVAVEEYNEKWRAKVSVNFPKWTVDSSTPAAPVVDAYPDGDTPF